MTFIELFCRVVVAICFFFAFIMAVVVIAVETIRAKRRAHEALRQEKESEALWAVLEKERRSVGFIADKEP